MKISEDQEKSGLEKFIDLLVDSGARSIRMSYSYKHGPNCDGPFDMKIEHWATCRGSLILVRNLDKDWKVIGWDAYVLLDHSNKVDGTLESLKRWLSGKDMEEISGT